MNNLRAYIILIAIMAIPAVAHAAEPGKTAVGVEVSRHKVLYFDTFRCSNLIAAPGQGSVNLGVLRLDGTPRKDDTGDCVSYVLPASFALVITKLSWLTQGTEIPCEFGSLLLDSSAQPNRLIFQGSGVTLDRPVGCSHEVDFGSGLIVHSPGSELKFNVPGGQIGHVDMQGYLVRP